MDRRFLEFWGNFLINAAKGQKKFEELSQWFSQDLKGFEDLTALFRKSYGLDELPENSADYEEAWQKAAENFQNSLRDYLSLMGVVPKDEHIKLVKKYEDLKRKVADQEETIKHLRMLLEEKGFGQGELVRSFQDLIITQTDQFQELMKALGLRK
jgi:hypothetical protein